MGLIKNGILGGVSGKVGNIIGASWNGIDYIRTKPDHVKNPNTRKQQAQRSKFKGVQELAQMLKYPVIRPCWNHIAVKMSGFNYFTQKNIGAFGSDGQIEDFSKIQPFIGSLPFPVEFNGSVDQTDGTKLVFEWKDDKDVCQFSDESMLNIIVLVKGSLRPRLFYSMCKRSELKTEIDVDGMYPEGTELNVYAFFSEDEFTKFSDSVHNAVTV